ncbi:MAG: DNRLRE domain-containing protein [Promethearchaeota archaeon]
MKKIRSKSIISICFLFLLGITMVVPVNGATAIVSTEADKDSHVNSADVTTNYGGEYMLYIGELDINSYEAYLHFTFTDKPFNWTKAYIIIDVMAIYMTASINLIVSLISDSWTETGITWLNKPDHRQVITTLSVSEVKVYWIDVSSFISGTDISICINASSPAGGSVMARSREDVGHPLTPCPQLVWIYEASDSEGRIPSYNVIILVSSIIGITCIIIIKKKKLKTLRK